MNEIPAFVREARRLAGTDIGPSGWAVELVRSVEGAGDEDLGTLVAAHAVLAKAAADRVEQLAAEKAARRREASAAAEREARDRQERQLRTQRERAASLWRAVKYTLAGLVLSFIVSVVMWVAMSIFDPFIGLFTGSSTPFEWSKATGHDWPMVLTAFVMPLGWLATLACGWSTVPGARGKFTMISATAFALVAVFFWNL